MEMSEDEILEEADRIRARRGLRVVKDCAQCSKPFAAAPGERYCSDNCRAAMAREAEMKAEARSQAPKKIDLRQPGESIRDYWTRTGDGPLNDREEETVAALERIEEIWKKIGHPVGDSTEIIRQQREERADYLSSL